MCVYMYIYIYMYMYIYIYICICISIYTYIYMYDHTLLRVLLPMFILMLRICPFPIAPLLKQLFGPKVVLGEGGGEHIYIYVYMHTRIKIV